MRTFIITLILSLGLAGLVNGQTERNRPVREKFHNLFHKEKTLKPRAQMKHFDALKTDKEKEKHNGTSAYRETHKRKHKVDGNGFAIAKSGSSYKPNKAKAKSKKRKSNKSKNKDSDTYAVK